MKKGILGLMVIMCIITGFVVFQAAANAEEYTEGYYTYTVSAGEATITRCDQSISGDVTIPDMLGGYPVTAIGDYAFGYCTSLTNVSIPDSVTSIGEEVFSFCSSLKDIDVDSNNLHYSSIDGDLYNKEKTTLIQYAIGKADTQFIVPDSVTTIGVSAFSDCSTLKSLTIPDSVVTISDDAFDNCSSLTTVTIGAGVSSMGRVPFHNCTSLKSITVDSKNKHFSSIDGNLFDKDATTILKYATGKTDAHYTIPNTVTTIAYASFCATTDLTSVTIPDSVTTIENLAFHYSQALTSIELPDSVTSLGTFAFSSSYKLKSVILSDNISEISYGTFESCNSLTNITLSDNIESIGNFAFAYCKSLLNINMNKSLRTIGERAFAYCTSLTDISIPDSVTSIGWKAFSNCTSLSNVNMGNGLKSIEEEAFASCDKLTSIILGSNVASIGDYAFSCEYLANIVVPDTVTYIGANAFYITTDVYYTGTELDWSKIEKGSDFIHISPQPTIHFNHDINSAKLTLTYNATGGTYPIKNCNIYSNTIANIRKNLLPTRAGYSFLGWATSADATQPTYQTGDSINVGTEDITLYALWEKTMYTQTKKTDNGFEVVPTGIPQNSNIWLVCYKDNLPVYIGKHTYNNESVVTFDTDKTYDKVKVFVWDNYGYMTPYTEVETF